MFLTIILCVSFPTRFPYPLVRKKYPGGPGLRNESTYRVLAGCGLDCWTLFFSSEPSLRFPSCSKLPLPLLRCKRKLRTDPTTTQHFPLFLSLTFKVHTPFQSFSGLSSRAEQTRPPALWPQARRVSGLGKRMRPSWIEMMKNTLTKKWTSSSGEDASNLCAQAGI